MADTRLYIGNRTLGLACRFYARLGGHYQIGLHEGMVELLKRAADECMDDEFIILHEGQIGERTGDALWFIEMDKLDPETVLLSEVNYIKERNTKLADECQRLHNQAVTMGRRLKDMEDRLSNQP